MPIRGTLPLLMKSLILLTGLGLQACGFQTSFFELPAKIHNPQAKSFEVSVLEDESLTQESLQGLSGLNPKYIEQQQEQDPDFDPSLITLEWWINGLGWLDPSLNGQSVILQYGTLTLIDAEEATFSYTPDPDQNGQEIVEFKVKEEDRISEMGQVKILIIPVNDAPLAQAQSLTGNEDEALIGQFTSTDVDDANPQEDSGRVYEIVQQATQGEVQFSNAMGGKDFSYLPGLNYNGSDQFTYRVFDGIAYSEAVTVSLNINAVNDAPLAQDAAVVATEDTLFSGGQLQASDIEDGNAVTYQLLANGAKGVASIASNGSFSYLPNANQNGADTFTFQAADSMGLLSEAKTVTVNINAVNDAPSANNGQVTAQEDTLYANTLMDLAMDPDLLDAVPDTLSFAITNSTQNGQLTLVNAAMGTYTYLPNANFNGSDQFSFQVTDSAGASAQANVFITVDAVNDAPLAQALAVSGEENTVISGQVSGSDVDGDALTFAKATDPANGVLVFNIDGSFNYTPQANFVGADAFTFKANDGQLDSAAATVTITVLQGPQAPVAQNMNVLVQEDTPYNGQLAAVDADNAADTLVYAKVSDPSQGTLTLNSDGSYLYTPFPNYYGSDSFNWMVTDPTGLSAQASVLITVQAVNDAPEAADQSIMVTKNTPYNGQLTAIDVDHAANTLNFFLVTNGLLGAAVIDAATGTFTYTPNADMTGSDSFTFYAQDPDGAQSTVATVSITINNGLVCITESFEQVANVSKKLDTLFVVDSSGSLKEEREAISAAIDSFIDAFPADVHNRLAVMLAHSDEAANDGEFYGGRLFQKASEPLVLDSATLSREQIKTHLQSKMSELPGQGSTDGGEAGLMSLHLAVSDGTLRQAILDADFFRADAGLAIIFVSDENDICVLGQVPDAQDIEIPFYNDKCTGVTPSVVLNELITLKGSLPLSVNGIVYTDANTVPDEGENEIGLGFLEIIGLNNGVAADLADTAQIANSLASIGTAANQKLEKILSYRMQYEADSVEYVQVAASPIPHTFVADTNQVNWDFAYAGNVGDLVAVRYCHHGKLYNGVSLADPPGIAPPYIIEAACLGEQGQSGYGTDSTDGHPTCVGFRATIYVNSQNIIVGGPLNGQAYQGQLIGTDATDIIVGTVNSDNIQAGGGDDVVCSRSGDDEIHGEAGEDTLLGGNGNNLMYGGSEADAIVGANGADQIYGQGGADLVCGSNGKDSLFGNEDNDLMIGGNSTDQGDGGAGSDTCLSTEFSQNCEF